MRGFRGLRCIMCGAGDSIHLDLCDVENFCCAECEAEFGPEEVEAYLKGWSEVLKWVKTAPTVEE